MYLAQIWNVTTAHQNAPDSSQLPAQIVVCISSFQHFRPPRSLPPKPRETLAPRTWTSRARRAAMAKNRNKKNKAKKSGGVTAMDTSEGGPATSTTADAPQRNFPLSISFIFGGVFVFASFSFYDGPVHYFFSLPGSNGYVRGKAAIVGHRGARFDQQVS